MDDNITKRDGHWVQHGPRGQILQIVNFKNGLAHGINRIYRDDGTIAESSYYEDGLRQSSRFIYNEQASPFPKNALRMVF